ncbi:MAG: chromosome partitioning protein ParB [Gemella sp.]|nr:MAG: chromosome partitioning protein ParB [Gemella sp.]
MQIEQIEINLINEYENNVKIHTDEQIEQIIMSIQKYGNNDPIAIDENNTIIEGHGRFLALKRLGYDTIPVIKLGHLTDEQKREYILIHNKLTMNTGFDMESLEKELDEIETDLSLYGFEQFEEFFEEMETEEIEDEEPTDETVKLTIKFSRTEYEAVVNKLETINNDHRLALLELLGGD